MILGKSFEQQRRAQLIKDRVRARGLRKFAWWPVQMNDGRWVWFSHYWEYLRLSWSAISGFSESHTHSCVERHVYEQRVHNWYCSASYADLMDLSKDKP